MSTSRKKVMKKLFKMLGIKTKGALSCDDYKKIIDSTIAWLDMEMDVSVTIADVKAGILRREEMILLMVKRMRHSIPGVLCHP